MKIHQIFPTIISESVNQEIDKQEYDKIINTEYSDYGPVKRSHSYILDELPILKNWIENQVNMYAENILALVDTLCITQSWAVKSENIHQLYTHIHPNSILSGAYFVESPNQTQGTTFYRSTEITSTDRHHSPVVVGRSDFSKVLGKEWLYPQKTFDAQKNHLYLFPSTIPHGVIPHESNGNRYVISFNTWFKDGFGNEFTLTRVN